jgi:hypothetical protein
MPYFTKIPAVVCLIFASLFVQSIRSDCIFSEQDYQIMALQPPKTFNDHLWMPDPPTPDMTLEKEKEKDPYLNGALEEADQFRQETLMRDPEKAAWIKQMDLSVNEVNCIVAYTGYFNQQFDDITRNKELKDYTVYYYTLLNALIKISRRNNEEQQEITLYRAFYRTVNASLPQRIFFPTFASLTNDEQTGKGLIEYCECGACLVTINTTYAVPIHMISEYSSGMNYLLPPTLEFEVLADDAAGYDCFVLQEVADHYPNITQLATATPSPATRTTAMVTA